MHKNKKLYFVIIVLFFFSWANFAQADKAQDCTSKCWVGEDTSQSQQCYNDCMSATSTPAPSPEGTPWTGTDANGAPNIPASSLNPPPAGYGQTQPQPAQTPAATPQVAAPTTASTAGGGTFTNQLNANTIQQVVTTVTTYLQGIIGTLAVLFIVIGGIMYMASAGNENMVKQAKNAWTGAVIGLAIALAAPSLIKDLMGILGATGSSVPGAIGLKAIATNTLTFLLSIVGIIAIIFMVIGGIMYMTTAGDDKRMETAKNIFKYSIIGTVIALASVVIVQQIAGLM